MQLGDEFIELMQFQTPRGRPLPVDSRSNDRWFQHVAIIVSDMDKAYASFARASRGLRVHRPAAPARLESECRRHRGVLFSRPRQQQPRSARVSARARARRNGSARTRSFSASITPRSWSSSTDRSLAFYRDRLGPERRGAQRQLRHRAGTPEQRGGRAPAHHGAARRHKVPVSSSSNTSRPPMAAPSPPTRARQTPGTGRSICARRRTPRASIALPRRELGYDNASIVRDPDGHATLIFGASP